MSAYNTAAMLLFSLMMLIMHHPTAIGAEAKETPSPYPLHPSPDGCPYGFKHNNGMEETPAKASSSTNKENAPGTAAQEFCKTIRELVLVKQLEHFTELKEIVYKLASEGHSICRLDDIKKDSFWYGKTLDPIIIEALKMNGIRACNAITGFNLFWSKDKNHHPLENECKCNHGDNDVRVLSVNVLSVK